MSEKKQSIAAYENGLFFEKTLRYAVAHKLIHQDALIAIVNDAATGSVQIAEYFGASSHLRQNLENAKTKMAFLVSLYLEHTCDGDMLKAANLLNEKPFRALSRGGSQLLKTLYSLPEENYFGSPRLDSEVEFLKKQLAKGLTVNEYRKSLERGQLFKTEFNLAIWLLRKMGLATSAFSELHAPVEHVIRTCLLSLAYGAKKPTVSGFNFPDEHALFEIFTSIRKEWSFLGDVTSSTIFLKDIPVEFNDYLHQSLMSIQKDDIPKIVDSSVSLKSVFDQLKESKYFFLYNPLDAVSHFDKLQAEEWFTLSGGNDDDASLLSLLLCGAAGIKPKVGLSKNDVKKIVLAIRKNGLLETEVAKLINKASHEEIEQLTSLWQDFIEVAKPYLLDKSDDKFAQVMPFLIQHCNCSALQD